VSARNIAIIDPAGRIAAVTRDGLSWAVHCAVVTVGGPAPCDGPVSEHGNRSQGILGAERHLQWHAAGKPVCEKCGARVLQKGQKRCRSGTCEVAR
jgi:hypothetical protein